MTSSLFIVFIILAVIVFAFEVWMFVDAIKNPKISDTKKLVWCIGMLLIHPFVAVIYYFTDHKANRPSALF